MPVNPRTGIWESKKTKKALQLKPKEKTTEVTSVPGFDVGVLIADISNAVAERITEDLKGLLSSSQVSMAPNLQIEGQVPLPVISIDESVIDVGIGDQPEMKKGEGSSTISKKKSTKTDDSFKSSKSKLKRLKGKNVSK